MAFEAQQAFPFKAQPLTLCAYEVDCDDVADLTDPASRTALGVDPAILACPWEDISFRGAMPQSWGLTHRLQAQGIAAIVVPGFAAGATVEDLNMVFWDWAPALPHRLTVIDDEARLPRDQSAWPDEAPEIG